MIPLKLFPGVPHCMAEDVTFLSGVSDAALEDLVSECAIACGRPGFFADLCDGVLFAYDKWEHALPSAVQFAAVALRRVEAERGPDAAKDAWFRAIEARELYESEAA